MTTYTISDVSNKKATTNGLVDLTNEEKQAIVDKWNAYESQSATRKLAEIKRIRLEKLIETDYLANSDVTMPDNIATWRQSLRDIPQDFSTEEQYDLLLARETDDTKDNFGQLTHSIWTQPTE